MRSSCKGPSLLIQTARHNLAKWYADIYHSVHDKIEERYYLVSTEVSLIGPHSALSSPIIRAQLYTGSCSNYQLQTDVTAAVGAVTAVAAVATSSTKRL